ncbi:MAG: fused MFS/spermidine synthase [Planctomycetes bacterium]|nr:fused MFS/spermidine synthase [Planctomycetota bacterium]
MNDCQAPARYKDRSKALPFALCYSAFFLSGVAALVYQVSWVRQLGSLLGHSIPTGSIVLTAYFAGLAAGARIAARTANIRSPLRLYGATEFFVALWACAIPSALGLAHAASSQNWLNSLPLVSPFMANSMIAIAVLFPAATALGISLPLMVEGLGRIHGDHIAIIDAHRAYAYALNLSGAVVGVGTTTVLMPEIGVVGSSYLGATLSLASGILGFAATSDSRHSSGRPTAIEFNNFDESHREAKVRCCAVAAVSGFGLIALEVLYLRLFSLVLHNSTYSFGAITAVFLTALAIGASFAGLLLRTYSASTIVGYASSIGALTIASSMFMFVRLTSLSYFSLGHSLASYAVAVLSLACAVVGPPVVILGTLLPSAWSVGHGCRRSVGTLTAINTLGAAAGAMAGSFLLLPTFGLWTAFLAIAGIFIALSFWIFRAVPLKLSGVMFVAALTSLVGVTAMGRAKTDDPHSGEKLIRRWNSAYGWIDVVRIDATGALKVSQNLHYRFGTTGNAEREHRQAHLPLLLHENPRDVLFLGLGTGATAGASLLHESIDRIEVVELIPEVIEAARLMETVNYGIVSSDRVEIRVDDARHYLLLGNASYDVIISDLFVPWESETGYLYSVEHFQRAMRRLRPGGMMCQWLPLYQLGEQEFEMIANSFAKVFPGVSVWWGHTTASQPIVALIGSRLPLEVDATSLSNRLDGVWRREPSVDENLRTPERLFDLYQGDWLPRHDATLNTDEHPRLEFMMPLTQVNRRMLSDARLLDYYDRRLSQLPTHQLQNRTNSTPVDAARRNAWRRIILASGLK